jgi:hypothetical protein
MSASRKFHRQTARKNRATGAPKKANPYQQLVATVAQALDKGAQVDPESWLEGPDGRRDMDVSVRGTFNGRKVLIVIECKDWGKGKKKRPVGIEAIDALESKWRDVGADMAIICSNSGFADPALRKAARVGITAISAMKQGNDLIRYVVRQPAYLVVVSVDPPKCKMSGSGLSSLPSWTLDNCLFEGRSLSAWIRDRFTRLALNWFQGSSATIRVTFREPITLHFVGLQRAVTNMEVTFAYTPRWYVKLVTVDASAGFFDHNTNGIVIEPAGKIQYHDVSYYETDPGVEPLDSVPAAVVRLCRGELPDIGVPLGMKVQLFFGRVTGVGSNELGPAPELERFIADEVVETGDDHREALRFDHAGRDRPPA